jgi:hypothetical protein
MTDREKVTAAHQPLVTDEMMRSQAVKLDASVQRLAHSIDVILVQKFALVKAIREAEKVLRRTPELTGHRDVLDLIEEVLELAGKG